MALTGRHAMAVIHGVPQFTTINLNPTLPFPVGLALADIDGDGLMDVVSTSDGSSGVPVRIVWWKNLGGGTFSSVFYVVTTLPSASALIGNVAVADLDQDGRRDIISWRERDVSGTIERRMFWVRNLGGTDPVAQFGYNASNETANQLSIAATGAASTVISAADLNGDTRPDILGASSQSDNSVSWVPNLVAGFGSRVIINAQSLGPSSIISFDLDNDTDQDILVTNSASNLVTWFQNLGGGNFGAAATNRKIVASVSVAQGAAAGDVTGDGWPDIVAVGPGSDIVGRYAHNGSSTAPGFGSISAVTQSVSGPFAVDIKDLDSDGWQDVIIAASGSSSTEGNRIIWCENLGAGNFGPLATNRKLVGAATQPIAVQVADLDLTGTLDIVGNANNGSRVIVYRNVGGQMGMTTADSAPSTLIEGRRAAALRIAVTNRGIVGDNALQLGTLTLRLESSPGTPLSSVQANALLDKIAVHLDGDASGTFDPDVDPAVATVTELVVTNGIMNFAFPTSPSPDIQVAQGATRTYFVVPKIAEFGATQVPNTFRISHVSHGAGRSVLKDASNGATLSIESAAIVNAPSTIVTAQPAHTFTDYAHLYFDSATAPGTGATEDFDGDGNANLAEFAFGMNPTVSGSQVINVASGVLVERGLPVAQATNTVTGVTYQAIFGRRLDTLAGLTYTVQFSANLTTWVSSTATPTVLASDGVIEAVAVPYPLFVNGRKARFFRVVVSSP